MPKSPNTTTATIGSPSPLPDEPPPPEKPPRPRLRRPPNPELPPPAWAMIEGQRDHRAASIETGARAGKPW